VGRGQYTIVNRTFTTSAVVDGWLSVDPGEEGRGFASLPMAIILPPGEVLNGAKRGTKRVVSTTFIDSTINYGVGLTTSCECQKYTGPGTRIGAAAGTVTSDHWRQIGG
jgi:hypothetical protein